MTGLGRLSGRLLGLLLIVLAIWAGSLLARGIWLLLEPQPQVVARVDWSASPQPMSDNGVPAREQAEQIAASYWFGRLEDNADDPEPEPVQVVEMPETRLQLVLRGVVARQDPAQGSALIAREGRTSEYFRVGDTLFDQAELIEVHGNRVVLNRGGELETLSFDKNLPAGANGESAPQTAQRQTQQSQSSARSSSAPDRNRSSNDSRTSSPGGASASRDSGQQASSAQQRLEEDLRQAMNELQARAQSDPQGLMRQYGLEPTDGGYRVTSRAGILIANGLRPGDRITEINDQPVGNIDRDQQLVDSVLGSDQVKITLERSGSTYRFYQSLPSF
ncbi:MAG: hypothetical protein LAT62_05850 [Natronospirillum sp.]|uniref:type II secretion system protein N n=1 Tax=Natronospirillum sp. TaxID=2812955 RepID=UPI0025E46EA1|nr:type II secretion system protein N [Natronospirillum sp.]MCH8551440.1 hypothetical protein [Natronospirillum sp.]